MGQILPQDTPQAKHRDSHLVLSEWLILNVLHDGSQDSLEQLVKLWYPILLKYALRQVSNEDLARDITQNCFESILKGLPKLRDPATFPSWAYQILHRRTADALRSTYRNQEHVSTSKENVEHAQSDASSDKTALVIDAEKMMRQLPAELYSIMHLHYFEQLDINDIARILAIPPGTVKSRLHRARKEINAIHDPETSR